MKRRIVRLAAVLAAAASLASAPAWAAVGDVVNQFVAPVSGVDTFCSIGLAFDGTSLYYDRCGDTNIYKVNPVTGALEGTFDTGIFKYPNALAYDKTRNGLWIGPQDCNRVDLGRPVSMPIYFWDFDDDSVTPAFNIPFSLLNPATDEHFLGLCFLDGLAFNAGDESDPADDELWFSDDVNRNLGVLRPDGSLVRGYDSTTVDASMTEQSGLAIGGPLLYLGNDGGGAVYRALKAADPLTSDGVFVNGDGRQEDMECDPVTFAPTEVMWVRTTPQGGAFPDHITAYEIEPNSCGLGGGGTCGNGELEGSEECDDGNNLPGDGCSPTCTLQRCGDGEVQSGEQCDDGNTAPGDGCDANCRIEPLECCVDRDGDGSPAVAAVADPEECVSGPVQGSHTQYLPCGPGGALVAKDCDDADPAVHPGAAEIPGNGIDENCNGFVSCGAAEGGRPAWGASAAALAALGIALGVLRRRARSGG